MSKKVYPDWVQAHKVQGTTIKKVGTNYYLYKHTSKRVPGKKYPRPVDTLSIIIRKWSPESYLGKERHIKNEGDFHYQFAAQMGSGVFKNNLSDLSGKRNSRIKNK